MTSVYASGTLQVTGEDEVVIDETLPQNKALLENPEAYIVVQFDPSQPAPPPCAGGLPDEVDWELFYQHVHDVGMFGFKKNKRDVLKLKILWRVQSSRTIIWQILQEEPSDGPANVRL
jgi:hypothetical protein